MLVFNVSHVNQSFLTTCFCIVPLWFRALDGSSADVSEDVVRDFLQLETGHLTPSHLSYFSHWLLLCCLEATTMEAKNGRKRVWLQTAEER